ncbi:FBD-associated F-box protein At2g26860-like [Euphorbia lathyris]|uniref:FBD-associated F-box protein At2g26860-like n=1 Tax=Euphorbia lathyris TaxID=212925 RepID=UPI003313BEFB
MEEIHTNGANRSPELEHEEDRISDLPDVLIQFILSFLLSTKQVIQTGILSKRWENLWTHVPVLIFDSSGKNDENFSRFIDNTLILHDCPKVKKFHIKYDRHLQREPQLTPKIRFATRKYVEELILHCDQEHPYLLPNFLYNNVSLINLELFNCCLTTNWEVNWSCLKTLKLECSSLHISAVENAVSGSPLLEWLELTSCDVVDGVVIASKSLKSLIFVDIEHGDNYNPIGISCPKLEELCLRVSGYSDVTFANLPCETIKSVLSCSSLLCSLELRNFLYYKLVIASYSLKKLVLGENDGSSGCAIVISCPNLEELNMYGLDIDSLKLMKLPSLVCATLDFNYYPDVDDENTAKQILEQLQELEHATELNIGSRFIKTLSDLEVEGLSSPLLNCKCLTVDGTNFDEHIRGILCVIRSSPMLEKLVIKVRLDQCQISVDVPDLNDCREKKHWNSDGTGFNCFLPQLKTVEIVGLSDGDSQCKLVLHFVEFLLKNAIALEKMVLVLKDGGTDLVDKVSQKLLSIPKCSRHATVELLCSD